MPLEVDRIKMPAIEAALQRQQHHFFYVEYDTTDMLERSDNLIEL